MNQVLTRGPVRFAKHFGLCLLAKTRGPLRPPPCLRKEFDPHPLRWPPPPSLPPLLPLYLTLVLLLSIKGPFLRFHHDIGLLCQDGCVHDDDMCNTIAANGIMPIDTRSKLLCILFGMIMSHVIV